MSDDKVFQSVGAATEKDLAPYVFSYGSFGMPTVIVFSVKLTMVDQCNGS